MIDVNAIREGLAARGLLAIVESAIASAGATFDEAIRWPSSSPRIKGARRAAVMALRDHPTITFSDSDIARLLGMDPSTPGALAGRKTMSTAPITHIAMPQNCAPSAVTLAMIAAEVQRGRKKFPGRRFLLAALAEEVGELAEAMADGRHAEAKREAIQCAAVAVRIAEEGDATTYQLDGLIQLLVAAGHGSRFLLQRAAKDARNAFSVAATAAHRLQEHLDPTFADVTDEEAQP